MKPLPSRTSWKAASSRGISGSYSARTSTRGIVCTRRHFSRSHPSVHEIRHHSYDAHHDCVLDVAEVVLEVVVARTEGITDADEREGPHGRAHEGQNHELGERHLEQPSRNRD